MDCFEWQARASDYLDGTLVGPIKEGSDQHLEVCADCRERDEHYRILVSVIATRPRSTLPVPIRRSPLSSSLPRLDLAAVSRTRWERIPWYLRTMIEGTAIVLLVLLGISAGPRIRSLYETSLEHSLDNFGEAFNGSDSQSIVPLARGKVDAASHSVKETGDDFSGEGDESAASDDPDDEDELEDSSTSRASEEAQPIKVGSSEIWRFNLKTDSPHELRPQIVRVFTELRIPAQTPGIGGLEAPGGIQFDVLVPQSAVASLKRNLQKLSPPPAKDSENADIGETFTWYRNRSKRKLPDGKTRVVIWLSQM